MHTETNKQTKKKTEKKNPIHINTKPCKHKPTHTCFYKVMPLNMFSYLRMHCTRTIHSFIHAHVVRESYITISQYLQHETFHFMGLEMNK